MKRITLKYAAELAKRYGYTIEKSSHSSEGGYCLWSNEKMPGVEDSGTLGEMYSELYGRLQRDGAIDSKGNIVEAYARLHAFAGSK